MNAATCATNSNLDKETENFPSLTNLKNAQLDKMLRDAKIPGRSKARRKSQKIALLLQHLTPAPQPEITCTSDFGEWEWATTKPEALKKSNNFKLTLTPSTTFEGVVLKPKSKNSNFLYCQVKGDKLYLHKDEGDWFLWSCD